MLWPTAAPNIRAVNIANAKYTLVNGRAATLHGVGEYAIHHRAGCLHWKIARVPLTDIHYTYVLKDRARATDRHTPYTHLALGACSADHTAVRLRILRSFLAFHLPVGLRRTQCSSRVIRTDYSSITAALSAAAPTRSACTTSDRAVW